MHYLGAHVSVAGGLPRAFEHAEKLACTALQIFVKNASRWQGRALHEPEIEAFQKARSAWGDGPIVAHAAYLINLAAPDATVLERSRRGLADELERCRRLGVEGLVVHPGAHLGSGEGTGLATIAASLDHIFETTERGNTRVLLEATAGQGTVLGSRLEQLETIIGASRFPEALGVCLDTCHLMAAGYPVDTTKGIDAVIEETLHRFGRERLACVHLNDSQHPRGSHRDRHANIGEGTIGEAPFAHLVNHPQLCHVPLILETPMGDDNQGHARDLDRLRHLARATSC